MSLGTPTIGNPAVWLLMSLGFVMRLLGAIRKMERLIGKLSCPSSLNQKSEIDIVNVRGHRDKWYRNR